MTRASRPITVTLGAYQEKVEARVASGEYASASEVVRAGLRALEEQEQILKSWMRLKVRRAYDEVGDDVDIESVFDEVEAALRNENAADEPNL
jgi:antitoxin ParD1/3/4